MIEEAMVWPPDFKNQGYKRKVARIAAEIIARSSKQRRVVVQAGGCSGLWALELAKWFKQVVTFEPEVRNFQCLRQNTIDVENIAAYNLALSDHPAWVGLTRPKPGAGLWRIEGAGDTQAIRLDDFLDRSLIDALVLDVEGHEIAALNGAEQMVMQHRPLLWLEFNHGTALSAWLADHEYDTPRPGIGEDKYSKPREWAVEACADGQWVSGGDAAVAPPPPDLS